MKKVYILPIILLLFSCTSNKKGEDKTVVAQDTTVVKVDPKQKLVGEWKEHWGIGMKTNVKSSDTFKIQLNTNRDIVITSTNKKKYAIDQLLFDGKELSFRKQNKFYPKGKFYVYYKLKLNDNYTWMEGPVKNSKKQSDYVQWGKVKLDEKD